MHTSEDADKYAKQTGFTFLQYKDNKETNTRLDFPQIYVLLRHMTF